jgi:sulfur-oxidizing protein SoxZ
MALIEPRVQAPGTVTRDDLFQVRTLIAHPMETGLRRDSDGQVIPRKLINRVSCRYNGATVFSAELHEAVAANPYLSFYVRASDSGVLEFVWEEDGGAVFTVEKPITVAAL